MWAQSVFSLIWEPVSFGHLLYMPLVWRWCEDCLSYILGVSVDAWVTGWIWGWATPSKRQSGLLQQTRKLLEGLSNKHSNWQYPWLARSCQKRNTVELSSSETREKAMPLIRSSCRLAVAVCISKLLRGVDIRLEKNSFKILPCHELADYHKLIRIESYRRIISKIIESPMVYTVFISEKKFDIKQVINL